MSAEPFSQAFDKHVESAVQKWHVPGVAFAVVHGTETYTKSYGVANVAEKTPVDSSTLFYVASTTKAHLCAAWALYIDSDANKRKPKDQQISFSAPLAKILPADFVLSDPIRTSQVTIEDAVSHRTGLARHELAYGYEGVKTMRDLTRNLRNLPFKDEPRASFTYCNTPFVAASLALEAVTGQPLAEALRERLWSPIGMNHTYGGYGEAAQAVKDHGAVLAKGYRWKDDPSGKESGSLSEMPYMDFPEVGGAGWAISTANDYVKWMRAFLDPSPGPLTQHIIADLWRPRSIVPAEDPDNVPFDGVLTYGLGWFISSYKSHPVYWHTGGLSGAGSYIILVPDIQWGLTFLANGQDVSVTLKGLAVEMLDVALGVPEAERVAKKKADKKAQELYRKRDENFKGARSKLYANAPAKPTMLLSLPVEDYAGTFRNVAYGPVTLRVTTTSNDPQHLLLDLNDRTWKSSWTIFNVNGEHWLAASLEMKFAARAQTRIGPDGKLQAWGLAMEPDTPDLLFWFEKA